MPTMAWRDSGIGTVRKSFPVVRLVTSLASMVGQMVTRKPRLMLSWRKMRAQERGANGYGNDFLHSNALAIRRFATLGFLPATFAVSFWSTERS